jgi:hypothetical protein
MDRDRFANESLKSCLHHGADAKGKTATLIEWR